MTNTDSSNPINMTGLIIAVLFSTVISGILIWMVGFLSLGLTVESIRAVFLGGLAIAVTGGVIIWLLSIAGVQDGSGLIGGIVHLVISAITLMISARFLPGLQVNGLVGALESSL